MADRKIKRYGYIPDLPDHRDYPFSMIAPEIAPYQLPRSTNNIAKGQPAIYDQGQLGSCTGNAAARMVQQERIKLGLANANLTPSRLMAYFHGRRIEGTVDTDAGAMPRDVMVGMVTRGLCFEEGPVADATWPYDISKFATQPSPSAYAAAKKDEVSKYYRLLQDPIQLKTCLAVGYSFEVGFTVYESFESQQVADTGIVPMPGANEGTVGGHAVVTVDYDDDLQCYIVANSWGLQWGLPSHRGYFRIPYAYWMNADLAGDFWTVRLVTS